MKLKDVALWCLLLVCGPVHAQNCTPGWIKLTTQDEVDNFQANHGPCTQVTLELDIQGAGITNLNGLAALEGVVGLYIGYSPALTSLTGLDSLQIVDLLTIEAMHGLSDLTGLGSLAQIDGDYGVFNLANNDGLTSLSGLPAAMQSIKGSFSITDSDALTSLTGLPASIDKLGGLGISGNASLQSLDGFPAIGAFGYVLDINDNPMLHSLAGLSGINYLPDTPENRSISVTGNSSLTSLAGIPPTNRLEDLRVFDNAVLSSLAGLDGLEEIWWKLFVYGNPALTDCSALRKVLDDVDDGDPGPGPENPGDPPDLQFFFDSVFLESNAGGCNSITEIVDGEPSDVLLDDGFETKP